MSLGATAVIRLECALHGTAPLLGRARVNNPALGSEKETKTPTVRSLGVNGQTETVLTPVIGLTSHGKRGIVSSRKEIFA